MSDQPNEAVIEDPWAHLPERWRRWNEWVEKNARPKQVKTKKKRKPTRFQKRGPMKEPDWARFKKWSKFKALSKQELVQKRKEIAAEKARIAYKKATRYIDPKKLLPVPVIRPQVDMYRINELAVQRKYKRKKKYVPRPPEVFTFMPNTRKKDDPPLKFEVRKFMGIEIPKVFYTLDKELDFWRNIEYYKNPFALTAVANETIIKLAEPKEFPRKQHCKFPTCVYPLKRIKMSPARWACHLIRLQEFLAKPKIRLDPPEPCVPFRKKKPMCALWKIMNRLSIPKGMECNPPEQSKGKNCKKRNTQCGQK